MIHSNYTKMPLSLAKIAEVTGGIYYGDEALSSAEITGVVRDDREVTDGCLFLCIRGERVDGHIFAPRAYSRGALCCLCEYELPHSDGPFIVVSGVLDALTKLAAYYRRLFDIPFVGVVGSVGKTTTKEMCAAVLRQKLNILKTPENLNNEIGVPLTLLMLRRDHEAAVIEMGISDFGEMTRLTALVRPDIVVFTNVAPSHLQQLRSLDGVLKAKSEVFTHMPPNKLAVLCCDDVRLRNLDTKTRRVTYGIDKHSQVRAESVAQRDNSGFDFIIAAGDERISAFVPGISEHLVTAALAATAVGKELGLRNAAIVRGISSFVPIEGRAGYRDTGYITVIDDCYNANPASMRDAINSLSAFRGRKVAILGDMNELGDDSETYHREMGAYVAARDVNLLLCCGEKSIYAFEGFLSANTGKPAYHFPNKNELMAKLAALVAQGDTVLVKASHSMRFYEIVEKLMSMGKGERAI